MCHSNFQLLLWWSGDIHLHPNVDIAAYCGNVDREKVNKYMLVGSMVESAFFLVKRFTEVTP